MKRQAALFALTLLLGGGAAAAPWPIVRYWLSSALLWVLPGLGWASLALGDALDRAERVGVGLGLSFVATPLVVLLLSYRPGPLTRASLIGAAVVNASFPIVLCALVRKGRRGAEASGDQAGSSHKTRLPTWGGSPGSGMLGSLWRDGWAWLLAAVLIATGLRFVNLNYSEFQGDEAAVMVRAARALTGDETIVFQHKKGPAELAVVMAVWRLTGITSEWMARLPFAWASVLGVTAIFLLGRRMGQPHAGGIAACMVAIDGYFVGFGRIVQYQSLTFALGSLGLLCLVAYSVQGHGRLVVAGGVLLAGAVLSHYDAILTLPAALFLVSARLWHNRRRLRQSLVPIVIAVLLSGGILGAFYLPFLHSSYLGSTVSYVSGRIGIDQHVYNHLWSSFRLSTVYSAVYLLVAMFLGCAVQTVATWARPGPIWAGLALALLVTAATGLLWPQIWSFGGTTAAWVPVGILLAGSLVCSGQPAAIRFLWLWLGVPGLFYLFFVALPLTHIHTLHPAMAILAGLGLVKSAHWLSNRSKTAMWLYAFAGAATYAVCGFYAVMLFVDHTPEYMRHFPASNHPLYWTPYQQKPKAGLFGFPYRAGWKAAGYLMDREELLGSYDSNEEPDVTDYYMRRATRLGCASPDHYVIAPNVQDEVAIRWDQVEAAYHPALIVTVGGEPKLTVHSRERAGNPATHSAEEYEEEFDAGSTPERVAGITATKQSHVLPDKYVSREALFGDFARLVGYRIQSDNAVPGGYVELALLWQVRERTGTDYHVFTHLYDGEIMRGQLDGQPVCGNHPTSHWQPDQYVLDPYRIPVRQDAPLGPVPLTVGLYDFQTMGRVPVSAPDGSPVGDQLHLIDVTILPP